MYYLDLSNSDNRSLPFFLAAEEYAARYIDADPLFFFWQVGPSVIMGRNQDMHTEVDINYCREHGVDIFRRKSGGGCVYADKGNLMISYIEKGGCVLPIYSNFVHLVTSALKQMGIAATSSGRNDIMVDGGKVSGTAFYHLPGRGIVHGTLLYDTNMRNMEMCLTPPDAKLASKGIKSVRSRINLLKDYTNLSLEDIKTYLRRLCSDVIIPDAETIGRICEIEKAYTSETFIRGRSGKSNVVRKGRIEGCGSVKALLLVEKGKIIRAELCGDFFTTESPLVEFTVALRGVAFTAEGMHATFKQYPPQRYVVGLTEEKLLTLLFG